MAKASILIFSEFQNTFNWYLFCELRISSEKDIFQEAREAVAKSMGRLSRPLLLVVFYDTQMTQLLSAMLSGAHTFHISHSWRRLLAAGRNENNTMAFNFGGSNSASKNEGPAAAPAGGFSFGAAPAPAAASGGGGFSFGGASQPAPAPSGGGGFGFGGAASITTTPAAGVGGEFSLGGFAPTPAGGGFGSGAVPAAGGSGGGGFSFGGASALAAAPAGGFSLGGSAKPAEETEAAAPASVPGGSSLRGASLGAAKPAEKSGGGFAFGGSAPATKTPPAGGGGSFAFGGTPAPATTPQIETNAPAPVGGFAFGGTPAAAAPAPAQETKRRASTPDASDGLASTAAPAGGFSFGGASPDSNQRATLGSPVATPAQHSGPTSVPDSKAEPVRLEYQTLTVETIINKYQQELEKDSLLYLEEARQVSEYDAILRDSQRDISRLVQQTHRCILQQEEVERTLSGIGAFQNELDSTLNDLESNVDSIFTANEHLNLADADVARETAYTAATNVEQRLQTLCDSLKDTLQQMSSAQDRMMSGDAGKVVQILNQHQNSLIELEAASRQMDNDISHVSRVLSQH
jgi:nuclear pore complex protein Nup62